MQAAEMFVRQALSTQRSTHYFVACFVNPREGKVIDVLNSGDSLSMNCHVRERGVVDPLFPIPIHRQHRCVASKPITAVERGC